MTPTRLITGVFLLAGSVGLTLLALGDSPLPVIGGAVLLTTSTVILVRHFWRAAGLKREREHRSQMDALAQTLERVRNEIDRTRTASADATEELRERFDAFALGILEHTAQVGLDTAVVREGVEDMPEELSRTVQKGQEVAERRSARQQRDLLGQVSGVIGLYSTLRPRVPYPPFGGWAIGGDCAQRLVSLIFEVRPRRILEAGSGLSTILAAQALEIIGGDGRIVSLEHEEKWLELTGARLREHGIEHRVDLVHAPLIDVKIGNEAFIWYDLDSAQLENMIDLFFIDGPPMATGPLARYPGLPLLYDRLTPGAVVLMDDADRPDEREAIERWGNELPGLEVIRHGDAKGTVEIRKTS